jgi:hypothetical protein
MVVILLGELVHHLVRTLAFDISLRRKDGNDLLFFFQFAVFEKGFFGFYRERGLYGGFSQDGENFFGRVETKFSWKGDQG